MTTTTRRQGDYAHGRIFTRITDATTLPLVHVTPQSGNAKTGNIPVTYRPMTTCANDCAFLPKDYAEQLVAAGLRSPDIPSEGGCYGTGRIFGMARKFAATITAGEVRAKLARAARSARFLRDRVVGDILTESGTIDHGYIATIAKLAREAHLIPFGYTHAWRGMTSDDVAQIRATGYIMNASCETRDDVRAAVDLGMPVTIASDIVADGEMIAGKRVVTCPAQTREDVTCASCGLCARGERAAVVRFQIHGTARKRAASAVQTRENGGK
jgi:hypothetical protein